MQEQRKILVSKPRRLLTVSAGQANDYIDAMKAEYEKVLVRARRDAENELIRLNREDSLNDGGGGFGPERQRTVDRMAYNSPEATWHRGEIEGAICFGQAMTKVEITHIQRHAGLVDVTFLAYERFLTDIGELMPDA